jgi:predicted RNA-binding Zn-ribbon protein involved in translation (DUF1610 family)
MAPSMTREEYEKVMTHPALPIAEALMKLGYRPKNGVWNAALRMARTPDLAKDMMIFVNAGQPAINYQESVPQILFRALPLGYSIATLIQDFGLKPVGAFLIASDLIVNLPATKALLDGFARNGVWITDPSGKHGLFTPPASDRVQRAEPADGETGPSGEITPQELVSLIEQMEARGFGQEPEADPATVTCVSCGAKVGRKLTFCPQCGKKIGTAKAPETPAPPATQPKHCPQCGTTIQPGKKFCPQCGNRID